MQISSATAATYTSMNPTCSSEASDPDRISDREYADFLFKKIESLNGFIVWFEDDAFEAFKDSLPFLRLDQVLGLPDSKKYPDLKREKIRMCALSAPSIEEATQIAQSEKDSLLKEQLIKQIAERSFPCAVLEEPVDVNTFSTEELEELSRTVWLYRDFPFIQRVVKQLPINNIEQAALLLAQALNRSMYVVADHAKDKLELIRMIPKSLLADPCFVKQTSQNPSFSHISNEWKMCFFLLALSTMSEKFPDIQDRLFERLFRANERAYNDTNCPLLQGPISLRDLEDKPRITRSPSLDFIEAGLPC